MASMTNLKYDSDQRAWVPANPSKPFAWSGFTVDYDGHIVGCTEDLQ